MPRSKPDGFSVNVRCLDDGQVRVTRITLFDGEHWEEAMAKLRTREADRVQLTATDADDRPITLTVSSHRLSRAGLPASAASISPGSSGSARAAGSSSATFR